MKSSVKGREMAWEQHELLSLTYSRRDGRRPGRDRAGQQRVACSI